MKKIIKRIINIILIIVFLIIDIQSLSMNVYASSQEYVEVNDISPYGVIVDFSEYLAKTSGLLLMQTGCVAKGDFVQFLENDDAYWEWFDKWKVSDELEVRTHSEGGRSFDVLDISSNCLDELRQVIEDVAKSQQNYVVYYPKTAADIPPGNFGYSAAYAAYMQVFKERGFALFPAVYKDNYTKYYLLREIDTATRSLYLDSLSSWNLLLSGRDDVDVRLLGADFSYVYFSSYMSGSDGILLDNERSKFYFMLRNLCYSGTGPVYVFKDAAGARNFFAGFSPVYFGNKQYSSGAVTVPVDAQVDYDKLYATVQQAVSESAVNGAPMDVGEIETLINDTVAAALKEINDSLDDIGGDIGDIGGDVEQTNSWLEKIYDRLGAMDEGNTALMQEIASRLDAMGSDALKLSDFNRWMQKLYDSLDGLSPGEPVDHTAVLESILDKLTVLDRIEDAVSESNRLLGDIIDRLGGVDDANAYLSSILEKLDGLGTDNSAQYEKFNQWLQKIYDELKGSEELGPVLDGIAKKLDSIGGDIQLSNEILQDIYDRLGNTEHMDNLFGHLGERLEDGFKSVVQSLDVILAEIKSFKRWFIADSVLDAVNDILEGDTHPGTFRSIWDLMKRKFPFCLVWDFVNMVGLLLYAGAQDTPVFTVPFQMDSIDFYYEFTIDFTVFGKCITVLKFFMVLFYCRMLMFISMRVTAGKG